MVGDAEVLQAQFVGCIGHLAESCAAVAGGGVIVEDAAQILELDEVRQTTVLCGLDLAFVLAQFGVNEVEIQRAVELGFIVHGRDDGRIGMIRHGGEGILIEGPAARQGTLADDDVVLLAAGKVHQREGEFLAGDSAEIALHAVRGVHAGFGGAFGDDAHDEGKLNKRFDDLLGVLGRNEEVEIVHGFLATAEAAADLGVRNVRMLAQRLQNLLREGMHLILAKLGRVLLTEGDAVEDLFHRLAAEAGELGGLAALAGTLQISDGGHAQLCVQGGHFFGAEAGDVEELKEGVWKLGLELFIKLQLPGGGHFVELVPQGLAEALDAGELVFGGHLHDVATEALHDLRAGAVGAHLEGVFPLQLQEQGDAFKDGGGVFTGHARMMACDGAR